MVVVGSIEEELARVQMEKAEEEEASKMQNNTGNTDSVSQTQHYHSN